MPRTKIKIQNSKFKTQNLKLKTRQYLFKTHTSCDRVRETFLLYQLSVKDKLKIFHHHNRKFLKNKQLQTKSLGLLYFKRSIAT